MAFNLGKSGRFILKLRGYEDISKQTPHSFIGKEHI